MVAALASVPRILAPQRPGRQRLAPGTSQLARWETRRMGRRIWENLGTFLVALALAVLVWIVALNESNPIQQKAFGQTVPINLINTPPNTIVTNNGANRAVVSIRAPQQTWLTLAPQQIQ